MYASGGNDNRILAYHIGGNKIGAADTIKLAPAAWDKYKVCPTGIAVNKSNTRLYTVTKEDSALYVVDPRKRNVDKKGETPQPRLTAASFRPTKNNFIFRYGAAKASLFIARLLVL